MKLTNNSVFGKTNENVEKYVDMKLVTDRKKSEKLAAKINFDHTTIFSEDLVAVWMKRTNVYYNKPIYLGMSTRFIENINVRLSLQLHQGKI